MSHPEQLRMPADTQHSATIVNGVSRIGYMAGGQAARWRDEDFPTLLTEKAHAFMRQHQDQPFFLYFSFHDIHVPRIVAPQFEGVSEMGPRGDAIAQMDWVTGQLVAELERLGLAENTLLIFSSDNGPVLDDGYGDMAIERLGEHDPAGGLRGGKYSVYEAGTRVPTLAWWPGRIQPGTSDALLTQVDLYASLAALTGQALDKGEAPDSYETLAAWLGERPQGREEMLEEAFTYGLRQGPWKYIMPQPQPEPGWFATKGVSAGFQTQPQLYDLSQDRAEATNVAADHPERVAAMGARLDSLLQRDGSRPGWQP
ncbi:MAG: hypothetical protein D6722_03075 [Bacteroidetes bacterium]|nr:MAG: hypothetical protein D6722_03075 [Bacteroidota bacterium]